MISKGNKEKYILRASSLFGLYLYTEWLSMASIFFSCSLRFLSFAAAFSASAAAFSAMDCPSEDSSSNVALFFGRVRKRAKEDVLGEPLIVEPERGGLGIESATAIAGGAGSVARRLLVSLSRDLSCPSRQPAPLGLRTPSPCASTWYSSSVVTNSVSEYEAVSVADDREDGGFGDA
jgi:hypothetical protein